MRHRHVALLAWWLACIGAPVRAAPPPSAARVMAFADAQGEPAALAQFFSCGADGDRAYSKVASGAPAWLAVAVRLLPEADGCRSESLHDALARALVQAPRRVLRWVNTAPSLASHAICIPFLPAEASASRSVAYLEHERAVLEGVHDPALQAARRACLVEVDDTVAAIHR